MSARGIRGLAPLFALLVGCAAASARGAPALDAARAGLDDPARRPAALGELERFLAEHAGEADRAARADAAALAVELHALAAAEARGVEADAHWVALVTYAELAADSADPRLELELALAYARLGFGERAAPLLEQSSLVNDPRTAPELLERLGLAPALRAGLCEAGFDHLKARDELAAYRFAILALEGQARFGHALPEADRTRLEAWILGGASVQFVCPESRTPYVPGLSKSPISGVPHFDYVAVPRGR